MRPLRSFLTLLLTLSFFSGIHGQMIVGLNKDSLRKVLDKMASDSVKVTTLIRLGQQYESNAPDSAILYYRQAKALSQQLNYQPGIVQYINNYTAVLNVQGRFDSSLILNLQGVDICRQHGLQKLYVKALINTGAVYQYKEDYLKAADYYLKALPFLETSGDLQSLSLVYGNLCGLYRNLNQPEKATVYARRALRLAQKNKDEFAMAQAAINLGNALKDLDHMAEAIRYLDTARLIGRRLEDLNTEETALIDLGDAYMKTREPDRYEPVFREALTLARNVKDVSGEAFALQGIALGLYWKGRYRDAETQLQKAIYFSRRHDQKEVLSNLLSQMADVQIALGQRGIAQQYRDQYDSVRNQLFNATLIKDVQELETKYKVEKQQHELLQKTVELEEKGRESLRWRNWLIIAGASVLLLSFLLFLVRAQQENLRLKALVEGQLQERRRIGQEMHDDMGSGLTSLLFLSRTLNEPKDTAEKIRHLSGSLLQKMNEVVWTMEHEHDTLESLIAYIRVNVAQTLENAGMAYHFQGNEDIPVLSVSQQFRRNIYLVVKEAIHNVIRHAEATTVTITVLCIAQLEITIRDNGKGFDPASERRFGNGMKNMRQRMDQVRGTFVITSDNGASLHLTAPLKGL
jgi:two-component system NarL family sensor kinase